MTLLRIGNELFNPRLIAYMSFVPATEQRPASVTVHYSGGHIRTWQGFVAERLWEIGKSNSTPLDKKAAPIRDR